MGIRRGQLNLFEHGPEEAARDSTLDRLPDARDGLTREQRIILYVLNEVEKERGGRRVPTAMLYGRVSEYLSISQERFQKLLSQAVGRGSPDER